MQNNKIFRKIIYSKLFIVIFLVLSFFLLLKSFEFYQKKQIIAKNIAESQKKLDNINGSVARKRSDHEFIQSERGKEEYLRELMPVAKNGEKVIIIYDASTSPVTLIPKSDSAWFEFKKKIRFFIENYTNL